MAARSQWKGFLKISLVSVPVRAYTATSSGGGGGIRLNQLHAECHSRIKYQKTCPVHGQVPNDEIVSGYEYSKDQYVLVDTEELDKLRTEDDKAIKVNEFIPPETLDPIYLTGRNYYLVPEGPVGQKAFGVVHDAMAETKRYGVATVVMHGKEEIVLLRPLEGLLVMSILNMENEVTQPAAFKDEVEHSTPAADELELAKTLIKSASPKKFDFSKYKDVYTEKLTQLIEAKVSGKDVVAPPAVAHAEVINLMDALRKSVAQVQEEEPERGAKPPRRMAPSKGAAKAPARRRKSS
jgi:DNA end-binding protein Ku